MPLASALPVAVPRTPALDDHRIQGRAVVPAVHVLETMVAAAARAGLVGGLPVAMMATSFSRFLPVDELERCALTLVVDTSDGKTRLVLASTIALSNGGRRTREHATLTLDTALPLPSPPEIRGDFQLSAECVYRELIPFGPRFRNLAGTLRLGTAGAEGRVRSPGAGPSSLALLGCPFLFDSAMHLACVWAQRYAGVVAYPTGFAARTIVAPNPGSESTCVVAARSRDPRQLSFDVWLLDEQRRPRDVTLGLTLAAPLRGPAPPAWFVACPRSP